MSADTKIRDHGGGIDAAIAHWGGVRHDWLDLSTGINPTPYPIVPFAADAWTALPDSGAQTALLTAARKFWNVPDSAEIIAAPGASAIIARLPAVFQGTNVDIPTPTYNEHAAAFLAHGWQVTVDSPDVRVIVHPNNPTGRFWSADDLDTPMTVIDESFCDIAPDRSLINHADNTTVVLKSFGKFWGLAGIRLGFAIAGPDLIARLKDLMGPWAVSGPALEIGTAALSDTAWAEATRQSLQADSDRLDQLVTANGAVFVGGCSLFRLYEVDDALAWQERLAKHHIWSRIFPYSKTYLRLGLPPQDRWKQLEDAL